MLVEVYTVHDQRCIWASPSHLKVLGYDPRELEGARVRDDQIAGQRRAHAGTFPSQPS